MTAAGLGLLLAPIVAAVLLRSRRDPVALLSVFVGLLFVLPGRLVVEAFGGFGTPAALLALFTAWLWVIGRLSGSFPLVAGRQPVRVATLAYVWTMFVGLAIAFTRELSPLQANEVVRAPLLLVAFAGVSLLATDGVDERGRLETLLRRVVAAGVFLALVGLLQFAFDLDLSRYIQLPGLTVNQELAEIEERSIFLRPRSTALHPIEYGVVLAMVAPVALHFALHARPRTRVLSWLSVVVIMAGLLTSLSRSAILGVAAAGLVLAAAWSWRRRLVIGSATLVFLTVMWVAIPGLLGTLRNLFLNAEEDPSVSGRAEDLPFVADLVREAPWFGRGYGTYNPLEQEFLDNQLFETLIETGIIGAGALLLIFVTAWATGHEVRKRARLPEVQHLGQTLAAALTVPFVAMLTFDLFSFRMATGTFFLLLGGAGALWRLEVAGKPSASQPGSGQGAQPPPEVGGKVGDSLAIG